MLGERDEALGSVRHIPSSEPTTGREFVRAIFEEAGNPPKIGALNSTMVKTLDLVWPLAREGAEVVYQFERPVVLDGSKYRRAFGGCEVTPYREGIRRPSTGTDKGLQERNHRTTSPVNDRYRTKIMQGATSSRKIGIGTCRRCGERRLRDERIGDPGYGGLGFSRGACGEPAA